MVNMARQLFQLSRSLNKIVIGEVGPEGSLPPSVICVQRGQDGSVEHLLWIEEGRSASCTEAECSCGYLDGEEDSEA